MGFRVWGLEVWGLGFRGLGVWSLGFREQVIQQPFLFHENKSPGGLWQMPVQEVCSQSVTGLYLHRSRPDIAAYPGLCSDQGEKKSTFSTSTLNPRPSDTKIS